MSDKLRQLSGKKWERRGNNYVHKQLKSASRDMGVSEFRQNLTVNFYKTLAILSGARFGGTQGESSRSRVTVMT